MRLAVLSALLVVTSAGGVAAQDIGGYVTAGSGSIDYFVSRETIPQFTGGVLWRIADDRVRIGAEADAMTSNGYWAGKGGPLAEVTLLHGRRFVPFVRAGRFFGEDTSWIAGAGFDLWLTEGGGLRVMVQDAFRRSSFTSDVYHEPALQVGWTWR